MPPRLVGANVQERKRCLAALVVEHLVAEHHDEGAETLGNRVNSAGHTDLVVVSSTNFGLIHVMAIGGTDPNGAIPFQDEGANQSWLAEKSYVAFGWNDRLGRTLIFFADAQVVRETPPRNKEGVRRLANGELTATLRPI